MLVLSRRVGERIQIDDQITVVVQRISGSRVTLGIEAPDDVKIIRGELASVVSQFDDPRDSDPSRPLRSSALSASCAYPAV